MLKKELQIQILNFKHQKTALNLKFEFICSKCIFKF